jgi:hypothetical protein
MLKEPQERILVDDIGSLSHEEVNVANPNQGGQKDQGGKGGHQGGQTQATRAAVGSSSFFPKTKPR